MADDPAKTTEQQVAKAAGVSLSWLNLAVSILSMAEKLLPAFLVAWNNSLQQKNKQLSLKLDKAKLDGKVVAYKDAQNENDTGKNSKQLIDEFLNSKSSGGSDSK